MGRIAAPQVSGSGTRTSTRTGTFAIVVRAAAVAVVVAGYAWSVVGGSSCTDFDREDRIEDMRVLGIRTEPAEILYSPLHLIPAAQRPPILPLPTFDMDIEVFAFDPRGGPVSTSIQLCPEGAGDSTCRLYNREEDLAEEPAAARDELRALLEPQVFESEVAEDARPIGRITPNQFEWSFTPNVIDFFIPDLDDGTPVPSIFPFLPRVVVVSENLDQRPPEVVKERAFKRIPVTLDLTSPDLPPDIVADLAQGLGIELCTQPLPPADYEEQGRAACLEPRVANTNPDVAGFFLEEDEELAEGVVTVATTTPDIPATAGDVAVAPGQQLFITPVFAENVVERYQVISFDIEASKIIILNRIEDLALSWYSTRGEMSDTLTAEQFGDALGISWSLPADAASGERDSLVLVVVDQRGGTAFAEITVSYP